MEFDLWPGSDSCRLKEIESNTLLVLASRWEKCQAGDLLDYNVELCGVDSC